MMTCGPYAFRNAVQEVSQPVANASAFLRDMLLDPLNPLRDIPPTSFVAAGYDLCHRALRRYDKPTFDLGQDVVETDKPISPFVTLKRIVRNGKANGGPLLIVAPLSGHNATLLRDTVNALLPYHDVYITEWVDARLVPINKGNFGIDDYITDLMTMLRLVGDKSDVLAVCQSGPAALAATALLCQQNDPARPRTLTLMGSPIDTRKNPTAVNDFAKAHNLRWFEINLLDFVPAGQPGAWRRVYPGGVQLFNFIAMNLTNHMRKGTGLFLHVATGETEKAKKLGAFYDEYFSVLDLADQFFLETIDRVFHRHLLSEGKFMWRGIPVETKAITETALLTIEGKKDDICGLGQTKAADALCRNVPSSRRKHVEADVGHYGLFSGSKWQKSIRPTVTNFIREHSGCALSA